MLAQPLNVKKATSFFESKKEPIVRIAVAKDAAFNSYYIEKLVGIKTTFYSMSIKKQEDMNFTTLHSILWNHFNMLIRRQECVVQRQMVM